MSNFFKCLLCFAQNLTGNPTNVENNEMIRVYVPPCTCVSEVLQHLVDQVTNMEHTRPDSLLIILGDFKKANLSRKPPKYRQHIKCPTRDQHTKDHCYTILKDAYHYVPCAALGLSLGSLGSLSGSSSPDL